MSVVISSLESVRCDATHHLLRHWVRPIHGVSQFSLRLDARQRAIILTDSAPDAAGIDSSFFCFGFAFANELNRLLFSFFNGAGFAVGFDGGWLLSFCGGFLKSLVSLGLEGSGLLCEGGSFCKGRFAGIVVLEGALVDAAGGGRAPVLRCNRSQLSLLNSVIPWST